MANSDKRSQGGTQGNKPQQPTQSGNTTRDDDRDTQISNGDHQRGDQMQQDISRSAKDGKDVQRSGKTH